MLTQEQIKRVLHYNKDSGVFTWLQPVAKRIAIGDVAGNHDRKGYVRIRFKGVLYHAHRLAWLYVYGEYPVVDIDHVDCNKSNNSIKNLRLATKSDNATNRPLQINNTSGVKGVRWHKRDRVWTASFVFRRKTVYVGSFSSKESAEIAIKRARELTGSEFINNG